MITQPKIAPQKESPPQSTIETMQTRIRKCEEIAKLVQQKIGGQIADGSVKIREKPMHIEPVDDNEPPAQNPQRSIRDKIASLNTQLSMLQAHIASQKQQQRMKEERKKREASLLIERLKREKEEYRNKFKLNQMSSRLKNSVLSEDVIKLMKERRDSLIQQKKKDMELRIYKNLNRRAEREDDQAKNEIGYWSKIKQIQEKKRHHSTKILPTIQKASQQPHFGVNLQTLQRKNSHKNIINLAHKRSFSKQDLTSDYHDIVNKFLERAKAKQAQSKSQNTPNLNDKSRIATHQAISQKNESKIGNSRVSIMRNEKVQKIMGSYIDNKHKLLGNQYLKQSLLRVDRSKSPRVSTIQDQSILQQSLELKGNPAIFSRNDKLTNFEERRQKILHSLLANKIDKAKAVQMLNPVDNMLDRIDPQGIEARLRQKLGIFQKHQRKQQQHQYWNEKPKKKSVDFEENNQQII